MTASGLRYCEAREGRQRKREARLASFPDQLQPLRATAMEPRRGDAGSAKRVRRPAATLHRLNYRQ